MKVLSTFLTLIFSANGMKNLIAEVVCDIPPTGAKLIWTKILSFNSEFVEADA